MSNKIALGTAQFGLNYGISNNTGQTPKQEVKEILDYSIQKGVSMIDTAQAYGDSEKVLGIFNGGRFKIVSKFTASSNRKVEEDIQESLQRLNVTSLYAMLYHSADNALEQQTSYKELKALQSQGRIKKIGYSVYTVQQLEELIKTFGIPDIIQIPYSYLDRRFEKIIESLHQKHVEIHSRSTFLQGLLFMNPEKLPSFFNPVKAILAVLQKQAESKRELLQLALGFVISNPNIDKVVVGVNNLIQLKEIIEVQNNAFKTKWVELPELPDEIVLPSLWPQI